jgi:hypothetical protein
MTQTLYAHINKRNLKKFFQVLFLFGFVTSHKAIIEAFHAKGYLG